MRRTKKSYERVFEDLMQYTDFTNVNQIQTREDLRDFFKQVKQDSASKGRVFKVSNKMVYEFSNAVMRLGGQRKERASIQNRKEKVKLSRKIFINYEQAKKQGLVVVNQEGKSVYRSSIKSKKTGKTVLRFRDSKGRFAKKPF